MGGSGLIATRLGLELAELGHEIHFLFYKRPFFLKDNDKLDNVTFHMVTGPSYALFRDIGSQYTIQAASKLAEIVRSESIDLIHSHYAIPHAVSAYLAAQIEPVLTVVTTHGSDAHTLGPDPSYNETIGLAIRNASAITSVSEFLARETENVFNLPKGKINVIYDFIDTEEFRPPTSQRRKSIVQASNFRPIKQVPFLIEIFAQLREEFPDWDLELIGNGPDRPTSVRKARQLKIKDKVKFLGVRNDIPDLFSTASIMASTSRIESFGVTLGEAMACETPVLAPLTGGIPELIVQNKTGLLFELDSIGDAVEKFRMMMNSEDLRTKMGKAARRHVETNFSTKNIVKQYEQLYYEVIDNCKSRDQVNFQKNIQIDRENEMNY
ncbi:MAG: N-acetyl-alpha-D-glucosaminyl L-malate synthase BshA [Candidatus Heimdallarchaeota archaeon]|nr:N-acetyl-alpha-D-glucosaminyl L-malate synthase BshA [Candidatus Heimdallarchaeota archaeon]